MRGDGLRRGADHVCAVQRAWKHAADCAERADKDSAARAGMHFMLRRAVADGPLGVPARAYGEWRAPDREAADKRGDGLQPCMSRQPPQCGAAERGDHVEHPCRHTDRLVGAGGEREAGAAENRSVQVRRGEHVVQRGCDLLRRRAVDCWCICTQWRGVVRNSLV